MEKNGKFSYYLSIFLISPALAFFYGLANFKEHSARLILLFFFGAFGFTMILTPGKDSYDLVLLLTNYFSDLSFVDFLDQIGKMLTLQKTSTNIDEPFYYVVSYIVAQFTNSANWLYLVIGLIFGFFYIKGVTKVYKETGEWWNLSLSILFVFFFSWVSLNGINAPRNWTACWVFFCGAFSYLKTRSYKYLFLVLSAPLIHFAYLLITIPFFVYVFFKDLKHLYIIILLVSYLVSANTSFVTPYLESTELGKDKVRAYVEADRWQEGGRDMQDKNLSFHAEFYRLGSDVSIQFMFIMAILFLGYFSGRHHDPMLTGLASIGMLILSLSNIFSSIPVLSNRLFVNFGNFALAYLLLLFSKNFEALRAKHWIINICIPAVLLFLFTQYSQFGDFMDFRVLFSPLMYPFLGDDPISMKNFLRQILGV